MIYRPVSNYLRRRAISLPWHLSGTPVGPYDGAIVIPSLAEHHSLPETLQTLASNPPHLLQRFLILVVVNNRTDAPPQDRQDNLATLAELPLWRQQYGLEHLHWVDAASPGRELSSRDGVGLARKVGLDLALPHLDYAGRDPLLICLDGDTRVQADYLPAIAAHFASDGPGGAALPFRHRPAATPAGQEAIDRYELFLRTYVLGLELAGSPWAFHTVGSAMACRASAYVACGGMNRRQAGEDFYFLQQLHKVAGVAPLKGTCVYPSPRSSHRVPFGTGRAVGDMLADGRERLMFYDPQLFTILGQWLKGVEEQYAADGAQLLELAGEICASLRTYLEGAGFGAAWDNLQRHNPSPGRLMTAFHGWMDAFRTMRLMHHLTDSAWPRLAPQQAVTPLLAQAGQAVPGTLAEQLELLRRLQGG